MAGSPQGFVGTWTLEKGQVLELAQVASLAGTPVQTNHPVAVFGGSQCVDIPDSSSRVRHAPSADPAHPAMVLPLFGSSLREPARRRATAARRGRDLEGRRSTRRDQADLRPREAEERSETLSAGQILTFSHDAPFTVKSQGNEYPFYVAVYMTGATTYATQGDPDFVNIVPDDQFLDHYVFFVDYTYADSNLTFVRKKDKSGFHDVTLDCAGKVTGWKPLGQDDSIEYAWVDLTRARTGVKYGTSTCSYGRHEASSDGAFGLYVWGEDFCASYGFPAGAGSRPTSPYTIDIR